MGSPDRPDAGAPSDAVDFARVEALFAEIVDLDAGRRAEVLTARAGHSQALQAEVRSLLAVHDRYQDRDHQAVEVDIGTRLGAYLLRERIGEGGMGFVFRAERADGVFAQDVAVKVTRTSIGSQELLRFTNERQILATLDHPNIVRLIDGGAAPTGQAYLVMENVAGVPLTEHCRTHALSLERRLRIFAAVCDAVQYAHQHAIVHRDLKPDNILVTANDMPKVVDFGIAKLVEAPVPGNATITRAAGAPMTPNYASPEQLRGLPVTIASDVYALGVILYELIAGSRPYETEGETLDRVLDIVLHTDPPRPSAAPVRHEATPLPYPRTRLRGDLDAIVGKAMSKDPATRYASARELAEDLARFQSGNPIVARAPSAAYLLGRLAARNKVVVAATTVATVMILGVTAVALWQRQVAVDAQRRAEERFTDVRQLANTLIFKIHDAVVPLAGSTTVRRTIVDEAIGYLEGLEREAGDDVALKLELAAAYRQVGSILGNSSVPNLGDRPGAVTQYERARAILAPLVAGDPAYDTVAALVDADVVLSALYGETDREHSRASLHEAVDIATRYQQRHPGEARASSLLARVRFRLAQTLPPDEGIPVWRQTLADYERLLAADPTSVEHQRNVALVCKYLGGLLEVARKPEDARVLYARSLELDERRLQGKPDDQRVQFDAAISFANLASVSETQGDLETAAAMFDRSLVLRRQLAASDPKNIQALTRLGFLLGRLAKFHATRDNARAQALGREAVEVLQRVVDVSSDTPYRHELASAWGELGRVEQFAGRTSAACRAFRRSASAFDTPMAPVGRHVSMRAFVTRELATCPAGSD